MLTVSYGAHTDPGLVRSHNEDAFLAGRRVWAVADGMGGHAAGDVASTLAIRALEPLDERESLTPGELVEALASANRSIVSYGATHRESLGLGTTVTGVAAVRTDDGEAWAIFNVGDSRVYVRDAEGLRRATVDHSETEELVLAGLITPDEAREHPSRHVITRNLGSRQVAEADLWLRPALAGERFVICSDGLNSEVIDDEIARIADAHPDPQEAAEALVAAAIAAGGRDNVTVVVVDIAPGDESGAPPP